MTSNSVDSLGDEGRVRLSDTMGAGSTYESDISITDFPSTGSCLVDPHHRLLDLLIDFRF